MEMSKDRVQSGYGISTVAAMHLDVERALERIAAVGFREVEIVCDVPHFDLSARSQADVRNSLQRLGLTVRVGHSPIERTNCGALEEKQRQASVRMIESSFEQLAELGAEFVIVHANGFFGEYTWETRGPSMESSIRSLGELAPKAQGLGLKMAVENLPNRGAPRPGACMAEVLELIAGLPDYVGVCLDVGHAAITGRDPVAELDVASGRLFSVHLQDVDAEEDRHWVPGRGSIDWNRLIGRLDELDFRGPRTIEVAATAETLDDVLKASYEVASEWSLRDGARVL